MEEPEDIVIQANSGQAPVPELILHNAALEVRVIPVPGSAEKIAFVRLHTPAHIYSFKLDEGGRKVLLELLGDVDKPDIPIASADTLKKLGPIPR